MALDIKTHMQRIRSHAQATGAFARVYGHELATVPVTGTMACAVWLSTMAPVPAHSGLDATSLQVNYFVRLYDNAQREPADAIDPDMAEAVGLIMAALTGDFTLGGTALPGVRVLQMSAQSGYIPDGDSGAKMRVFTITVPVLLNDVFDQSE